MSRSKTLAENSAVAIVYVCLGLVASWSSATNGLSTAVWPSAGVALGALLARGNRLLPGIFIGSALSAAIDLGRVDVVPPSGRFALLVIVLAFASTLQAWFSARLVDRFSGPPLHLANVRAVIAFVLVAGPVACVTGATLSVSALHAAGVAGFSQFPMSWLAWWVGDSIGAIAMTPVVMAVLAPRPECRLEHGRAVVGSLLVSMIMVMLAFFVTVKFERANIRKNMHIELNSIKAEIADGVAAHVRIFDFFRELHEAEPRLRVITGFRDLVTPLRTRYPGILAVAFRPGLPGPETAAWMTQPPEMEDVLSRIVHELGPDQFRVLANLARASRSTVATRMMSRVSEENPETLFIMLMPADSGPGLYLGIVSASRMLTDILRDSPNLEGLDGRVIGSDGEVIFDSNPGMAGVEYLPREHGNISPLTGIDWRLEVIAGPAYLGRFSRWSPAATLLGGLLFIVMSCGFVLFLAGSNEALTREINEKEMAWTALRKIEGRKAAALEASIDAIIAMDVAGMILDFNKSAEKIFGHRAADVRGKSLGDVLIPERFREAHASGLKRFLESGQGPVLGVTIEVAALHATGHEFPVELQVVAVMSDGEPVFTGVVRDISARKRLEESLKSAKESAEAANAAKSQFLANMSHEIRTPLGAVIGFSDLLGQPDLAPQDRESYVAAIRRNGALLSNVINDILDLSKVEAGRLDIEIHPTDVRAILRDLETSLSVQAREKGIRFFVECGEEVPSGIQTDPVRLHQILLNIACNAVKFTRQGEVEVKVAMARPDGEGSIVKFSVRDTGSGLTPEQVQRIFRPFGQADLSTTRKYGGTGLGLVLAKKLANLLGGDVVLTSTTPGQGSVFTITIAAAGGVAAARKVS